MNQNATNHSTNNATNKDAAASNPIPATNDLLDEQSLQETIAEPEPGSDLEIDGLPIEAKDVPPIQPGARAAHTHVEKNDSHDDQ